MSLTEKVSSELRFKNIQFDIRCVTEACDAYENNISRIELYDKMNNIYCDRIVISNTLSLFDCLKSKDKKTFPELEIVVETARKFLLE